ncbi:MAG TPA: alpha/beta fold hydrolase [Kofleriaceae bacterium]
MIRGARLVSVLACLAGCGFTTGGGNASGDDNASGSDAGATSPDTVPPLAGPYPIVLAHGLFGFDHLGPLDYFYGIKDTLTATGRVVYAPRVDAVQSAEVRGQQLLDAIEIARMETGASKVIVIGHSQGGLDARWAANHSPSSIAAVVTIATPHLGSPVADVSAGLTPGVAADAANALGNLFGLSTSGNNTSFQGALMSLTSEGAAAFNAATPDAPGVAYYSVAGRSALAGASSCPSGVGGFMSNWDSDIDPLKLELVPVAGILAAASLPATPVQDGLVTVESATWGHFLGCIPADHLDQVCQVAGQSPGLGNGFDCQEFWSDLEQYLTSQGY